MRLSVNPADRGYRTFKALPKRVNPRVLVDGAEVKRCVTADDRTGYVLAIAEDADGQVRLNAKRDGIVHQQLRGHVVIELQRV